ncbi:pirin family protein [Alteromonas sp. a30]|uniref:pirin family protein n=1 Tax=Alteromonas sp. a30 TaxID=2730917 RepID=UPI00228242B3|nr:pirin family protein [Alteromonas sp. a30]MCY7295541.1 pirin family protein [Alteromonas sp. a30]
MLITRSGEKRGLSQYGWLKSYHSFSFAGYYDPRNMGVSVLRVINDDTVAPGAGFPTHGHRDMEIISYVIEGSIRHKDSDGHEAVLSAGQFQVMTAGTGISHSEYNDSNVAPLHFLQIWILPNARNLEPRYEKKSIEDTQGMTLVASGQAHSNALFINQDVNLHLIRLSAGTSQTITLDPERIAYFHIVKGDASLESQRLLGGDAGIIIEQQQTTLHGEQDVEAILFDLPRA